MKRFYIVGFVLLVSLDTLAQLSFKLSAAHAMPLSGDAAWLARIFGQIWVYVALACYVGGFLTWMSLLKRAPIGPAFAVSHLEIVPIMLISWHVFAEPIGWWKAAGAASVIAGIVCLALAESRGAPAGPQR